MGVFSSLIGGLRVHTKITPLVFTLTSISRLSLVRFQPFYKRKSGLSWTWTTVERVKADERQRKSGEANDDGQRRTNNAALKIETSECNSIDESEIVISKPIRGHFGVITEHI